MKNIFLASTIGTLPILQECPTLGRMLRLTEPEHICQKIPGKDTGAGVDVNGGVGKTVQQELLVDDVLAVLDQKLLNRHAEHLHILADLSYEKTKTIR